MKLLDQFAMFVKSLYHITFVLTILMMRAGGQYFSVREKGEGRREKGEPVGVNTVGPLLSPHSPLLSPHSALPTPHFPPRNLLQNLRSIGAVGQ